MLDTIRLFQRDAALQNGIFVDNALNLRGVTDQFIEHADVYHQRYFHNEHWTGLVKRAMVSLDQDPTRILDIGSGSGNTVFPLTRRFPSAEICASDISFPLLRILVETAARESDIANRLKVFCFDLHEDFFLPQMFDLIVGGSILHHMLDPKAALTNVAKWLRPGGRLVLFEPMEAGAHVTSALLHFLLDDEELPAPLASLFRDLLFDSEARFGVPRLKPWSEHLDDKWFFSSAYLRELASDIGLRFVSALPNTENMDSLFEGSMVSTIRISGRWDAEIPQAVVAKLRAFDAGILPDLKRLFVPDATIMMIKA
jgi:SAM-dependent methyltransferase